MSRGNPYHLPKGPKGGEFTHGPNSTLGKSATHKLYPKEDQGKHLPDLPPNKFDPTYVGRTQGQADFARELAKYRKKNT